MARPRAAGRGRAGRSLLPTPAESCRTKLVKYNTACRVLAEAPTIDEVKQVLDAAARLKLYAHQAKNRALEADAWEIRTRAERRVGEMMEDAKQDRAAVGGDRPSRSDFNFDGIPETPSKPTLDQIGIDKNLARRARTAAAIPEDQYKNLVAEGRGRITEAADMASRRIVNAGSREATKISPVIAAPGRYSCIVIDPPWPMEKSNERFDQIRWDLIIRRWKNMNFA